MRARLEWGLAAFCGIALHVSPALAQPESTAASQPAAATESIACASKAGERQHCAADTAAGVVLVTSSGTAECLLGKTWGYDDTGIWVSGGCAGEFLVGQTTVAGAAAATSPPGKPSGRIEEFGEFAPGNGFLVGRGSAGELSISGYALLRYVNQFPGEQTFTDHLGNERTVDGRNDFYPHRVMVFFKGWLGSPKLIYAITLWTVSTTDQEAVAGVELPPGLNAFRGLVRRGRRGLRRRRSRGTSGQELATAAIAHPDALVVVTPGLPQEAFGGPGRRHQHHAGRRVGRAVLALTSLRRAGDRLRRRGWL
jgi:hypothetical protein